MIQSPRDSSDSSSPLNPSLDGSTLESESIQPVLAQLEIQEFSRSRCDTISQTVSDQLLEEWESYLKEDSEESKLVKLKNFLQCFLSLYSIQPTLALSSFPGDLSFVCSLLAKELICLLNQIKLDIYKEPESHSSTPSKKTAKSCDKLECLSKDFGFLLLHTLNILCGQVCPGHVELPLKILLILKQIVPNLDLSTQRNLLFDSVDKNNRLNSSLLTIGELSSRNLKVRQILYDPFLVERSGISEHTSNDVLLKQWSESTNSPSRELEFFYDKIISLHAKSSVEIVILLLSLFENLVQTESIIGNAMKLHVCLVHGLLDVHKKICDKQIFIAEDCKDENQCVLTLFLRLSLRVSFSEMILVSNHPEVLSLLLQTARSSTFSFLKHTLQLPTQTSDLGLKIVLSEALNGTMLTNRMIIAKLSSQGIRYRSVLMDFLSFLAENLFPIISSVIAKIDENFEQQSSLASLTYKLLISSVNSATHSLIEFLDELFLISEEIAFANKFASLIINLITSRDVASWMALHILHSLRNSKTAPETIHNFSFTPFIDNLSKYHHDPNLQSQMLDIIENTLIRISDAEERHESHFSADKPSSHSWRFLEVYSQMLSPTNRCAEGLVGYQERKALLTHLARLLHLGGFQLRRTIVLQVLFPLLISINDCINFDLGADSPSDPEIKDEAIRLLELVSSSLQLLSKGRDHGQGEFFFEHGKEKELYDNYLEILFSWIGNQNVLRKAVIKSLKCVCMRESRQYFTDRFSFPKETGSVHVSAHPLNGPSMIETIEESTDAIFDVVEEASSHKIPLKNGTFLFGLILGLSCIPDPTDTAVSTELWRFAHEHFQLKLNTSTAVKLNLAELYLTPPFEEINKDLPAIISRLELHRDLWRALTEILSHQHHSSSFLAQWIVVNRLDDILVTCAHSLGKFMKKINEYLKFNPNSKSKPSLLNICSILISMFTYIISIKGLCCVVSKQSDRSESKNLQSLKRLIDALNGDCLKEIDFFKYPTGKYYIYTLMSLSTLTLVNPYKMNKKTQVIDYFATDHQQPSSTIQLGHLFTNSIREDFQNQPTADSQDTGYAAEIEDYLSPDLSFSFKKKQIQASSQVKPIIYFPEAVRRVFSLLELSISPSNFSLEILKDALPTFELLLDIIKSPYNLHVVCDLESFTKLINMCGHILVNDEAIANSECALMITRLLKILGKYSITSIQLKKLLLLFHKAKYTNKIAEILAYISDFSKDGLVPPSYFIPFPLTSLRLDSKPNQNDLISKKSHSIRLPKTEHKLQAGATFSLWLSVSPGLQSIPIFNIEFTETFDQVTHKLLITVTEYSRNIKILPVTIKQAKSGKILVGIEESLEFENIIKPGMWQNLVLSIWYDKEPKDTRGIKVSLLLYIDGVSTYTVKDIRFPDPHPLNHLALWSVLIGGDNPDVRVLAGVGSTNWKFCSLVVYRALLGSKEIGHIHNKGPHIINPYGLFNAQTIKNGELPGFLFAYSAFEHCTLLLSRQKPQGDSLPLSETIEFKMIDDQSRLIEPQILPHLPDVLHCWGGISALLYLVAMLVRDGGPHNEYPVSLVLQTIKSCCEYHAFTKESMKQINGIILLSRVFETKFAPVGELILEVFLSWCKDYNGRICSPEILQHILLNWRIWNCSQPVWEGLLKKLTNFLTVEGNLQIFQTTKTLHRLLFSLQERSLDKTLNPLSVEVANQYVILIRSLVEQQFDDKKTFRKNLRLITEFFFVSQIHPDPLQESIRVPSEEIFKLMNTTPRYISTKISPSPFFEIQTPENSLFTNNPIVNAARATSPEQEFETNVGFILPNSLQPFHPMHQSADLYSSLTNSVNIRIELEILNLIFSVLVNTPDSLSHSFFEYDTPLKPQVLLHDSCMYTVCHRTKVIETLRILYCRVPEIHRNRFLEMRGFHVLGVKLSKHSVSRDLMEACFQWINPAIKLNLAGELGLTDRTINLFNLHAAILVFYVIESCALACIKTCHQSLLLLMKLFQDIPNFANLVYKEHLLEILYTFAFHLRATTKYDKISEEDKNLLLKDIKTLFQIICFYSIISPSLFCMLENFLTFFHSYEIKCMNKPEYRIGLQYSRVVQFLALKESFTIILNMDINKISPPLSIGKIVDQDDLSRRFKELVTRALGIVLFTKPVFTTENSTFYPPSTGTTSYNLIEQSEECSMLDASITTIMSEVDYSREEIHNVDWLFASLLLLKLSEILLSLRRELYIKFESAKRYRLFTDKYNHLSQFFKLFSFLLHTKRPKQLRSYAIWCMLYHKTCRSLVKEIAGDEKGSPFYECKDLREKFLIRLVYKSSELFHFLGIDAQFFPPGKSNDVSDFFDRILERKQKSYFPRSFGKLAEIWDKNIKSEYSKLSDTEIIWQKEENDARTFWNQDMDNNRATVIESWRKDRKATQECMTQIDDEAHELHLGIKGDALGNLRRWHTHVLGCLHGWRFLIQNMMHDRSLWFRDDTRHKIWGLDPTEGPNRIRIRLMQMPCDIEPKHFNGNKVFSTETKHPMIYLFLDLPEHLKDIQLNEKPPEEEIILDRPCASISQDLRRNGTLIITSKELFFFSDQPLKEISHTKLLPYDNECTGVSWKIADLAHIYQRLCKLQDVALEFCLNNGHTLFLEFESKKSRDEVNDRILHQHTGKLKNNMNTKLKDRVEECIAKWRQGGSNFQLIMDINQLAGRTYNDLMQYPVFPFVLNDYLSPELNLNNPRIFRDLSLPLPAQLEEGRNKLMDNFNETEGQLMYTSLYSNTPSVLYFLIRIPPFTQQFLVFQGDKFDLADRCFHDMQTVWKQNTEPGSKSFKELIPEFFYFPEIFINRADLKLGIRQCKTSVANVILPSWASADPRMFVLKHRQALESVHVSKNIQKWLDLIFGYKQRDEEAVNAYNVFDKRLYSFADGPGYDRDVHLKMLEHTGQVPKQLMPYKAFPSKDYTQTRMPIGILPAGMSSTTRKPLSIGFLNNITPTIGIVLTIGYESDYFIGSNRKLCPEMELKESQSYKREKTGPIRQLNYCDNDLALMVVSGNTSVSLRCKQSQTEFQGAAGILKWGFWDNHIEVREVKEKSGSCCYIYGHPLEKITICEFIDNDTFVTGSSMGVVTFWRNKRDEKDNLVSADPYYLHGHSEPITALAICIPFSIMVTGSRDRSIIVWDINRIAFVRSISTPKEAGGVTCIAISHTLGDIAVACESGGGGSTLSIWTINGQFVKRLNFKEGISCIEYTAALEGVHVNALATGHQDGCVRFLSSWNLSIIRDLNTHNKSPITAITFGPNHKEIVLGTEDGHIGLWILQPKSH